MLISPVFPLSSYPNILKWNYPVPRNNPQYSRYKNKLHVCNITIPTIVNMILNLKSSNMMKNTVNYYFYSYCGYQENQIAILYVAGFAAR